MRFQYSWIAFPTRLSFDDAITMTTRHALKCRVSSDDKREEGLIIKRVDTFRQQGEDRCYEATATVAAAAVRQTQEVTQVNEGSWGATRGTSGRDGGGRALGLRTKERRPRTLTARRGAERR